MGTSQLTLTARNADDPEPDLTSTVVAHRAIRGDLARLATLLDAACDLELHHQHPREFCRYAAGVLAAIQAHDQNEDNIIWPVIAATARQAVDLAPLTDDHEAIEAASGRAREVLALFAAEPATHAAALRGSVSELRDLLDEHIADQEAHLYPIMRRYLPAEAYRWCEKQIVRKAGLHSLRFSVPWLARHAHDGELRRLVAAGGWRARAVLTVSRHRYQQLERKAFGPLRTPDVSEDTTIRRYQK
jgi:hemerythrin HHE cation binding domain-containing protein